MVNFFLCESSPTPRKKKTKFVAHHNKKFWKHIAIGLYLNLNFTTIFRLKRIFFVGMKIRLRLRGSSHRVWQTTTGGGPL